MTDLQQLYRMRIASYERLIIDLLHGLDEEERRVRGIIEEATAGIKRYEEELEKLR